MRFKLFFEAFKDIGKLTPQELMRGQSLKPGDNNFTKVDGRVYYQAVTKIRQNDIARGDEAKGLDTLTVYGVLDYKKMKCYLGKNNSSGYCIKGNGELVSVFSSRGKSGKALMEDAIKNGANKLDCFAIRENGKISGDLYSYYTRFGFKIDKSMNSGTPGESYSIQNGVSSYVDDKEVVHPEDPRVVIFMKR